MSPQEKQVMVTFKVPESLRDSFNRACAGKDRNASQVLREFMRDYIAQNGQGKLL